MTYVYQSLTVNEISEICHYSPLILSCIQPTVSRGFTMTPFLDPMPLFPPLRPPSFERQQTHQTGAQHSSAPHATCRTPFRGTTGHALPLKIKKMSLPWPPLAALKRCSTSVGSFAEDVSKSFGIAKWHFMYVILRTSKTVVALLELYIRSYIGGILYTLLFLE